MPLVVPVLRLAYVFLNVFETFKTLRLPPPSARNGGQPSARAMSQRKRAMKGCMTVWLVWVCFMLYERWVETFVWLFVPFYNEIKSLFILFFLLTRAKGAEPIYLHVLRPLIKPYTVPLDALFDALASFGDLLVLVAMIPIDFVLAYYRRWRSAFDPPQADPQTWHRDATPVPRPAAHRAYASEFISDARPPAKQDISTGSVRQTRSVIQRQSSDSNPNHQIWKPPASTYVDDVALNPHSGLPTPPIEYQQLMQAAGSPTDSDDWRQYPAFPSAYPPTPIVAPKPVRAGNAAQFAGIDEDEDEGEDRQTSETRQDFRKSLLLPREPRDPGSDGDLSDETDMKGVQNTRHTSNDQPDGSEVDAEMSVDEDGHPSVQEEDYRDYGSDMDDDEDDDDVFNTTLRTPYTRRQRDEEDEDYLDDLMLTPPPMKTTFSIDSMASRSTALSTTDNGSSLRTRSSVAFTALSSVPDAASLAGRKRRLPPKYVEDDVKFSVDVPTRKAAATGQPPASRPGSGTRSPSSTIGRRRGAALQEAAAEDGEYETAAASDESLAAKRQRVPGGKALRPKPQRADSSQSTIRGPSTRGRGTARTRATVTVGRPPSARVAAAPKERPVLVPKKSTTGAPVGTSERKANGTAAKPPLRTKSNEGN